jgi:hypothetical protein
MMKTVFKLIRIYTNSKARYPFRKTQTYDLGLFSTLANAEKQMHKDVKDCQEYEQNRMKYMAEDEEYHMNEKSCGHDIVLAYKITELKLDADFVDDIQSVRTYTANGQPNDECLLDSGCKRHFKGLTPDKIRFRPGDIVEVITEWYAELCIVWHAQPTTDDYDSYRQRCWKLCVEEDCKKPCRNKSIEEKEENCIFHWDYSDDSYLVYSLGKGDTHSHPESPKVFQPTKPVPKSLRTKLKAKYDEQLREEEEWKKQKELETKNKQ